MTKEKKIWLCEQYAQKAWTLSLNLAQEAARAGNDGRGYAVVADETRKLANNLFNYSAKLRFEAGDEDMFKNIVDFAQMTGLLSINTMIEILHVEAVNDKLNNKGIAVCADEVRRLAVALNELADKRLWQKPFVLPEIKSPLKSTVKKDFFFRFSIGGIALIENTLNIIEVCYFPQKDTSGKTLSLRGVEISIIDCGSRFGLQCTGLNANMQTVVIINANNGNYPGSYDEYHAVLIDDLDINTIYWSKIGYAVKPNDGHLFAEYSRECWDVAGGNQLVFIDWEKLIS